MIERLRQKYEVILGFVTLVISLSAFKDELSTVHINVGWTSFSLADYLLYCVYGFSLCLYLYVSESFLRETRFGRLKVLGVMLWIAVFLFGFILLTPVLVGANVLVYRAYLWASSDGKVAAEAVSMVVGVITSLVTAVVSWLQSRLWIRERKRITSEVLERKEIIELEHARKLIDSGYYSHSILESFKALESHLFRKLTELDYRVSQHRFGEIMTVSLKVGLLREFDIANVKDLQAMRNVSAHVSDASMTQEQAEFALKLVREIIRRSSDTQSKDD